MLVTKQPIFKKFWYPVAPISLLKQQGPLAFKLLETDIVIWQTDQGGLSALRDRCCHRSARLSKGKIVAHCLECPYHGWRYNVNGKVTLIPQLPNHNPSEHHCVQSYAIKEAYGYAWVALEDPICEIPTIDEIAHSSYTLIHEFYEKWNCAGLRVMENELDLAHPSFVHKKTFGHEDIFIPDQFAIEEFEGGLQLTATLQVRNRELQQKSLGIKKDFTTRHLTMTWFMPFTCKLNIRYDNGIEHIIVNTMTPIDDNTSQMVQFCLRNDNPDLIAQQKIIDFDRQVTLEDKAILEQTSPDVPLNHLKERNLVTDKPGILMRKQISQLLKSYGEVEVC